MILVDATYYQCIVGVLQHLTCTYKDIQHVVNKVYKFFSQRTKQHPQAVKRILRHLNGTQDCTLRFISRSPLSLYAFLDTDWVGCSLIPRSTTGFCAFL